MSKDLKDIDRFSKMFAKVLCKLSFKNSNKKFINDELALYQLVFAMLIFDMDFKNKGKFCFSNVMKLFILIVKCKFLDFMIILKNLNDGSNFDNQFLKESYKFTKLIGFK